MPTATAWRTSFNRGVIPRCLNTQKSLKEDFIDVYNRRENHTNEAGRANGGL